MALTGIGAAMATLFGRPRTGAIVGSCVMLYLTCLALLVPIGGMLLMWSLMQPR
jgi:hypothetical protein